MKIIYFTLFFTVCFFSCKDKPIEKAIEDNIPFVFPRKDMTCLLDSFIQEIDSIQKFNEIYIDKRYVQKFDIIVFSGKSSLSECATPLMRVKYKGVVFDVYSGVEHYFTSIPADTTVINDRPNSENSPIGTYWVIEDNDGELNIKKDFWALPFYTLIGSGVKFIPAPPIPDNK